tara:strand:- start:546 stop:788 length:243 start_codon:yes stop_codon:yes gene_type:complete
MSQTLFDIRPDFPAVHVTAEFSGKRYHISNVKGFDSARKIATDFKNKYESARFFIGDVFDSTTIDGGTILFRRDYYKSAY